MKLLTRAARCGVATALACGMIAGTAGSVQSLGERSLASVPAKASANALSSFFTTTGKVYLSVDGAGHDGTATIEVDKRRAGSTVRKAFMLVASTGFSGSQITDASVTLNGSPVDVDETTLISTAISSYNVRADVTDLVKPIVDAAPAGRVALSVTETSPGSLDGEVIAVVFDDPAEPEGTVALFYGAQNTSGDSFSILLATPVDQANAAQRLRFSLGISFGFQTTSTTVQFSQIDVNGVRLTSSAGGQDDGKAANGALLTVGGLDDSDENPADPMAGPGCSTAPRCDDELYNLKAVLAQGTTEIKVDTRNPSSDDNIFFAAIETAGTAALVGEGVLVSPSAATLATGATHTVIAQVQNASGQPVAAKPVTFTVTSGPNAGLTATVVTDASGAASFNLSSSVAGVDSVIASILDSSNNPQSSNIATVSWESAYRIQFAQDAYTVDESAGTVTVTLNRGGNGTGESSVRVSSADGTATAGADYAATSQTVVFAAGETSKTVSIAISEDNIDEVDETFTLSLGEVTGADLGSPASATVTITDNDPTPSVSFTTTAASTAEGSAAVTVTVTLSGPSSRTITVPLAVSGSAQLGGDYNPSSQALVFAPGQTSLTFTVTVVDDDLEETAETASFRLGSADNVVLGADTFTLTIAESDLVPLVDQTKTSGGGALSPMLLGLLAPLALLRRRRLLAAAALATASSAALAAPGDDWYVGVRAGPAFTSASDSRLTNELRDQGHDVTAHIDDDSSVGGTLYVGRRVAPNASIEVGAVYFGEYKASASGRSTDPSQLDKDMVDTVPMGGYAGSALLRYDYHLTPRLAFTPRIGGLIWRSHNKIERFDGTQRTDVEWGIGGEVDLGFSFQITPALSVGLGAGLVIPTSDGAVKQTFLQIELGL